MGVSSRIAGIRFDKTACTTFNQIGSIGLTTAYQTMLNITGRGYLNEVSLSSHGNVNTLRITVDGVVTVLSSANGGAGNIVGFVNRESAVTSSGFYSPLTPGSPNGVTTPTAGQSYAYPYTANVAQVNTLVIKTESIYFNSSLLIEVKNGAVPVTSNYNIFGGVL